MSEGQFQSEAVEGPQGQEECVVSVRLLLTSYQSRCRRLCVLQHLASAGPRGQ